MFIILIDLYIYTYISIHMHTNFVVNIAKYSFFKKKLLGIHFCIHLEKRWELPVLCEFIENWKEKVYK